MPEYGFSLTAIFPYKYRICLYTENNGQRSSRQAVFYEKAVIRNFTGCMPQAYKFIKKDSGTGVFLWILWNF